MFKKILNLLLVLVLLIGYAPAVFATDEEMIATVAEAGTISYVYDKETKTLTVSGSGAIPHYTYDSDYETTAPWWGALRTAEKIVIEDGVTSIGRYAFHNCAKVREVVIGDDVEVIYAGAFNISNSLETVSFGKGIKEIAKGAFNGSSATMRAIHISDLSAWCGVDFGRESDLSGQLYLNGNLVKDLVIPENVTELGDYVFSGNTHLQSVTIHNQVKSIGKAAFAYCYGLQKVIFLGDEEDSEIAIGSNTFKSCFQLTQVTLSGRVRELSNNMFEGCGFTSIEIPEGVKKIGNSAFYRCESLSTVQISDSVEEIGESAFCRCIALSGIDIPNTVKTIGSGIFSDCSNLRTVKFPADMDIFPSGALQNCVALSGVAIPETVISIGENAFNGCIGLTAITLPNGVTEIGSAAFSGCTALTAVTIPDGVTSICDRLFSGCTALSEVELPGSLTALGEGVFEGCGALTEMNLPNTVTTIGKSAFENCKGLTRFVLPKNVLALADSVFAGCYNMVDITLNDTLVSIGNSALSNCAIDGITIPATVESIGGRAFAGCSALETVNFLGPAPQISGNAFSGISTVCRYIPDNSWTDEILTSDFGGDIIWEYEGKATDNVCGESVYWELTDDGVLKITGSGAMYDYSVDELKYAPWYEVRASVKDIQIGDGVTHIGDAAFYQCTAANTVTMADSVVTIGARSFENCKASEISLSENLTEIGEYAFCSTAWWYVELPNTVTTIGRGAFSNSEVLTVKLPDGLENIPNSMFYGSYYLKEVTFPTSLKTIGDSAFASCFGLSGVVLPEGLLSIGTNAFRFCGPVDTYGSYYTAWRFKTVTLPDSLESIGAGAFDNCQSLQTINLPHKVKEIPDSAFSQCYRLSSITIPKNIQTIASNAFSQCKALKTIIFEWNAPHIADNTFSKTVIATCYYPSNNSKWTSSMFQNYGGKLTWIGQEMQVPGNGEIDGDGEDVGGDSGDDSGESGNGGNTGGGEGGTEGGGNSGSGEGGTGEGTQGGTTPGDPCKDGHNEVDDAAVSPTCTESGLTAGKHCSVCGSVIISQKTIAAKGHDMQETEAAIAPTCIDTGKNAVLVCANGCGKTEGGEEVPANGHNYEGIVTVPTCTVAGYTTYTCTVCDDSYVANEVEALGHSYKSEVTTEPTCTEDGVKTFTCGNCGDSYTEAIPATGHTAAEAVKENDIPATCTAAGSYDTVVYCSVCGGELNRETIPVPAPDHVDGNGDGACDACGGDMVVVILGDINGDGQVNSKDLVRLRKYFADPDNTEIYLENADVTLDGFVNSKDLVRMRKHFADGATFG